MTNLNVSATFRKQCSVKGGNKPIINQTNCDCASNSTRGIDVVLTLDFQLCGCGYGRCKLILVHHQLFNIGTDLTKYDSSSVCFMIIFT